MSHFSRPLALSAVLYTLFFLALYFLGGYILGFDIAVLQILFFLIPGILGIYFFKLPLSLFLINSQISWLKITNVILLAATFTLGLNFSAALIDYLVPTSFNYHQSLPPADWPWIHSRWLLVYCLLPAISEEVLFRGFLQTALKDHLKRPMALFGVALLFAFMHLSVNPWYFLLYFLMGLFFGWLFDYYRHIIYPILAHFFNNLIAFGFYAWQS